MVREQQEAVQTATIVVITLRTIVYPIGAVKPVLWDKLTRLPWVWDAGVVVDHREFSCES